MGIITNLAVCTVTAFAVWWTGNPWCLLALLLLMVPRLQATKVKCPACGHEFQVGVEEENNDN